MATMQQQTLVIVRLRCSDGVEGIGEATTIGGLSYGEEKPRRHQADHRHLPGARRWLGQDATNVHGAMAAPEQGGARQPLRQEPRWKPRCSMRRASA